MKKLLLGLLACLSCLGAEEFFYQQGEHISLKNGMVSISRQSRIAFQDAFSAENWRLCYNQRNALSCLPKEKDGRTGLLIQSRSLPWEKLAFELRSKNIEVTARADFDLQILAAGTVDLQQAKEQSKNMPEWIPMEDNEYHGFFNGLKKPEKYKEEKKQEYLPCACRLGIRWLNDKGQEISMSPFAVHKVQENLFVLTANGTIPKKTAYAQILIGADDMDFSDEAYLLLCNVSFKTMDGRLYPNATFVSQPFPMPSLGTSISWEANTPGHTALHIQLSSCENAAIGDWTPFSGAELDPQRAFSSSPAVLPAFPPMHRWLRYKVMMRGDGKKSPVLKSITVGEHTEKHWIGMEMIPPVITMKSAARQSDTKATLAFSISDDSSVEWSTVELKVDGKDISAECHREGNTLFFTPKEAFVPEKRQLEKLSDWDFNNREYLLNCDFKDSGKTMHIFREGDMAATAFNLVSPVISVLPQEEYKFSCDVHSNLNFIEKSEPNVHLAFLDAKGKLLGKPVNVPFGNVEECQRIECSAVSPENAAFAIVRISVMNQIIYDERFLELKNPVLSGKQTTKNTSSVNMHTFTVIAADMAGNKSERNFEVLFCPQAPSCAKLEENQTITWNGHAIRPIALDNMQCLGEKAKPAALHRHGFNFILADMDYLALEGLMNKKDFKQQLFWVRLYGKNYSELLQEVATLQNLPRIAGFVFDETIAKAIEVKDFCKLIEVIRGIAPGQLLLLQGKIPDETLTEYIMLMDLFMPEMGEEDNMMQLSSLSEILRGRPVLPLLQAKNNGKGLLERTCAALLCGAVGVAFDCNFPNADEQLLRLGMKLQDLTDIMSHKQDIGEHSNYTVLSGDKVQVQFCKYEGHQFIVFCNGGTQEAKVSFHVEDCDEARLFLDTGTIPVGGTNFTDTLPSGKVRIYELGKLFE